MVKVLNQIFPRRTQPLLKAFSNQIQIWCLLQCKCACPCSLIWLLHDCSVTNYDWCPQDGDINNDASFSKSNIGLTGQSLVWWPRSEPRLETTGRNWKSSCCVSIVSLHTLPFCYFITSARVNTIVITVTPKMGPGSEAQMQHLTRADLVTCKLQCQQSSFKIRT